MEKVIVHHEINDNGQVVQKEHVCVALEGMCPLGF